MTALRAFVWLTAAVLPSITAATTTIDFRVHKEKKLCVGNTVNKVGAGRRHNYLGLYVHSPGGAFSVISFRMAVIFEKNESS